MVVVLTFRMRKSSDLMTIITDFIERSSGRDESNIYRMETKKMVSIVPKMYNKMLWKVTTMSHKKKTIKFRKGGYEGELHNRGYNETRMVTKETVMTKFSHTLNVKLWHRDERRS